MTAVVTVVEDNSASTPTPESTATNTPEAPTNTPTTTPATSTPVPATPTPIPPATSTPAPTVQPAAKEITSEIIDFTLQDLAVNVGDTVTWVNNDTAPHTVTAGTPPDRLSGEWDSGNFNMTEKFSFTFEEAGSFPYFCKLHPFMVATVTVVEGGSASSTPSPSNGQTPEAASPTVTATPSATPVSAPAPGAAEVQSSIVDFELESLTISPGTTITWTNNDPAPHTTTAGIPADGPSGGTLRDFLTDDTLNGPSGEWDSGTLQQNQSFSHTFDEAGIFPYYCDIHPSMTGTITVGEPDSSVTSSPVLTGTAQPTPPPQSNYDYGY